MITQVLKTSRSLAVWNSSATMTGARGRPFATNMRIGKKPRATKPAADANLPVAQQQQPPPNYYQEQPHYQAPPSLATSMVHYLVMGFGLAFGIGLIRVAFGEGKTIDSGESDSKERSAFA